MRFVHSSAMSRGQLQHWKVLLWALVWIPSTFANQSLATAAQSLPDSPAAHYSWQKWTRSEGLPDNAVTAITQTSDGYLWVGTRAGLARFDGVKFTIFNRANTPAMINEDCAALVEDSEGNLWISTRGSLLRKRGAAITRYSTGENFLDEGTPLLCRSASGGLWVGIRSGLLRWQNGQMRRLTNGQMARLAAITGMDEDSAGVLWVAAENGIVRIASGTEQLLPPLAGLAQRDWRVAATYAGPLHADSAGNLWAILNFP